MAPIYVHPAKKHDNILSLAKTFGNMFTFVTAPSGYVIMLRNPKFKQPKGLIQ